MTTGRGGITPQKGTKMNYEDFMSCTKEQLFGILDGVHLEPQEWEAFYKACEDRGIPYIWDEYWKSYGV